MTAAMNVPIPSEQISNSVSDPAVFRMKPGLHLSPLESSAITPQFVASDGGGKSFVLSESLRDILVMFDGERSLKQVALEVSRREGAVVSEAKIKEVIEKYLLAHGLVEQVRDNDHDPAAVARRDAAKRVRKTKFNWFVFTIPLIKPERAVWLANKFTWLYRPLVAGLTVSGIIFVHVAFYGQLFRHRQPLLFGAREYLIAYVLMLVTAMFHEIGHAAACRTYKCEHGAIGFLLYMVFPAFYVNLSNAWRLSGRQRAVIDIGGVYFQLASTIPLFLLYGLTGNAYCAAVIYSVDMMVIMSLNPFLKFDGYWLLVDLTGLVNLQRRGWRVSKEIVLWSVGVAQDIPTFKEVRGTWRRFVLAFYSLLTIAFISTFICLLLILAPNRVWQIVIGARGLTGTNGAASFLLSLGRMLMNLFFLLFVYRMLKSTLFKVFKKRTS